MPISPELLLPSAKYLAIFDNLGIAKVLDQPPVNHTGLLIWDGTDWYPAEGTIAKPILLKNIIAPPSTANALAVFFQHDNGPQLFRLAPVDNQQYYVRFSNGLLELGALGVTGVPEGHGVLIRLPGDGQAPIFLNDMGLVYIDTDGNATTVDNGLEGQVLTSVAGHWEARNPGAGATGGGTDSSSLIGVSARNTSAAAISFQVPSMTLVNQTGDSLRVSAVNVSASLAASNGPGGIDVGAEATSKWYYFYLVAKETGETALVFSQSGVSPTDTNLGLYTFFALGGVVRNDASGNIIDFVQRGNRFWTRKIVFLESGAITGSFTPVPGSNLVNLIPPIVKTCGGVVGGADSTNETEDLATWMAADVNGLALQAVAHSLRNVSEGFENNWGQFRELPIIDPTTPQIFWKAQGGTSVKRHCVITDYTI